MGSHHVRRTPRATRFYYVTRRRKLLPRRETTCHAPRTGEGSLIETFDAPHSRNLGGTETRPSHHVAVSTSTCQLFGADSAFTGFGEMFPCVGMG